MAGLYENSEPISINLCDLKKGRSTDRNFLRYPDNFRTRYVAKKKDSNGGISYYFDVDGNPNTAEIILQFPVCRRVSFKSEVPVHQIRYDAAAGYSACTSTREPSYFEFRSGVRELVPSQCEYIKGLYKTSNPVSVDVSQLRKAEREYPFRYEEDEITRCMGKEDQKNGVTYYYFDVDGDRTTAEIVMLITNRCKDCADKVDKSIYGYWRIGRLKKISDEMASCPLSKAQRVKDGTLFGVYKKQKPIRVNIKHLFDKYREYRKRQNLDRQR